MRTICRGATAEGAKLIVLPEMCLTGYTWQNAQDIAPLCEQVCGRAFEQFAPLCRERGLYLAYGFAEEAGGRLYNSQNLIGPEGTLLATYRKTHLFEMDESWAAAGDTGFVSVATEYGRMGLGICMDLNFDDFVRYHGAHTDYLCFATNWLEEGLPVHSYWRQRLEGYAGTVFFANCYGQENGVAFCGQSAVYNGGHFGHALPRFSAGMLLTRHPVMGDH